MIGNYLFDQNIHDTFYVALRQVRIAIAPLPTPGYVFAIGQFVRWTPWSGARAARVQFWDSISAVIPWKYAWSPFGRNTLICKMFSLFYCIC